MTQLRTGDPADRKCDGAREAALLSAPAAVSRHNAMDKSINPIGHVSPIICVELQV